MAYVDHATTVCPVNRVQCTAAFLGTVRMPRNAAVMKGQRWGWKRSASTPSSGQLSRSAQRAPTVSPRTDA
jgi:hypothetical protein